MSEELKKGDEVSWNWGGSKPCKYPIVFLVDCASAEVQREQWQKLKKVKPK
jgi:hypothetical protein